VPWCGTSPTATLPTAKPATVEPAIEPRVNAGFEFPGEPDWLAAGSGSVWVKAADGQVRRIDPATNQVLAVIEIPPLRTPPGCDGLGASDDAVWTWVEGLTDARTISVNGAAVGGRFLRRVDPDTPDVVEDFTAPEQSGGAVLVASARYGHNGIRQQRAYRIRPD
jgi:hypothetical protein